MVWGDLRGISYEEQLLWSRRFAVLKPSNLLPSVHAGVAYYVEGVRQRTIAQKEIAA
jgi:hypothetical protein